MEHEEQTAVYLPIPICQVAQAVAACAGALEQFKDPVARQVMSTLAMVLLDNITPRKPPVQEGNVVPFERD